MVSSRVVRLRASAASTDEILRRGIQQLRDELGVQAAFPAEVEEAASAAAAAPRLPGLDRTDLEMVTVDPPGSTDLDQALHLTRGEGGGFVVHYAIADVAAFVGAGDPVDLAAHERGETLYGADERIPLHPTVLSEGAASLLVDQVRPALLWTITLDARGEQSDVRVERALVRSRAQLTYEQVQTAVDDGSASESLQLLREVGELRRAIEVERGGVSLPLPDQEVDVSGETWSLSFRDQIPAEQWNAQMSLLTGFAAASIMLRGRVGLLRTLPPPDPRDVERLRREAAALDIAWPAELDYPDFVRTLDPAQPHQAAMVVACTRLLRGSGYAAFDGQVPEDPGHAALASAYAHCTAPLRRLGDRYAGEVCLALCAGEPVPDWVRTALPGLPEELRTSARRSGSYERGVVDLVEAGLLGPRVGEVFDAVVVDVEGDDDAKGTVTVREPAVEAKVHGAGPLPLGEAVRVRLESASVEERRVTFALV